jgi:hypothetical protein
MRLSGSQNEHVYAAVKDGADIKRALKTLHDRLSHIGWGSSDKIPPKRIYEC